MYIGFDISQTGSGKAGCGYFAHAMIRAMLDVAPEHRYSIFPSFGNFYFDARMPMRSPYSGRNVHYGPRHLSHETARVFWNGEGVEELLGNPDIVHSNNFWCPVQLVSSRLVYTLYDIGFAVNPSWTTETNRVGCFEGVFRSSIAADWIVPISEASRRNYLSIFPHFPENRIRVVYPCSRFMDLNNPGQKPKSIKDAAAGKYWLSVGTIEPRKNQRRLVEAYARCLALGGDPMPLIFAGGSGWLMEEFPQYIQNVGLEKHIVRTGYITDEELIWLYRNCYAHLFPSVFEGFGLPVLEGMQFGAPTIASNATSIPEVAGEACILLSPEDNEGWAQAMLRISLNTDERDHLSRAARVQAARFEWQKSAQALLQLYEEALTLPKRLPEA